MRMAMEEVKNLLKSKIDFIWVNTYEEAEFIKDLTATMVKDFNSAELYVWSITEGLRKEPTNSLQKREEPDAKMRDPHNVIDFIKKEQNKKDSTSENFFVLRDFHTPLESIATLKRSVRDAKEYKSANYNPIIVVAPISYIPLELEKMIRIVNYDTISNEDITACVDSIIKMMNTKNSTGSNYTIPSEDDREKIETALRGLTFNEVVETIRMSVIKYDGLDLKAVMDEKIQLIQKSGVLDYKVPSAKFEDIGGNVNFKSWIDDVEMAMSEDATSFGCEKPKGYLSLGPPGTAKTYMAEALAQKFGVPFIKLEMSKIMDKLVGNSEKKIDQALKTVAACAPCVFLIDEVEKALGGKQLFFKRDQNAVLGQLLLGVLR